MECEFDYVGSVSALRLALETLIVQSKFQGYDAVNQLKRVRNLEERWEKMGWKVSVDIAELFADAHAAVGNLADAIRWYENAIATAEGNISFRTLE